MEWRVFDWNSHKIGQKGEVLNRNIYRCGFCKGEGFIIRKKSNCPVCLGKRTVSLPGLAVICAYCNGEGRAHLNRDLTCSVCKGKGVVPIESEHIEICSICKGLGRERGSGMPCLTCKGKGVIAKREVPQEAKMEEIGNNEEKMW
jgi:DnaJ-class molecular chaperone